MAVSRNPCRYCAKAHYDVVRNRMHQSFAEEWVIFNGKTKHIEVIKSMTLRTALNFIKMGLFYYAINNNEGDNDNDRSNESDTGNAGTGAGTENTSETND